MTEAETPQPQNRCTSDSLATSVNSCEVNFQSDSKAILLGTNVKGTELNSCESRLEAPRIKVPQYEDYVDAFVPREFARKLEFTVVTEPTTPGSGSTEDEAG